MERIIGLLISGFAVRLYAAGMALYVASVAAGYVSHVFSATGAIANAL